MAKECYAISVLDFNKADRDAIFGRIVECSDSAEITIEQRNAWEGEIDILQKSLHETTEGILVFEYSIPRIGLRPDVVLLLHGMIFVLEFKVGARAYHKNDLRQTVRYAEYLSYFHSDSHNRIIVPLLIATEARQSANRLEINKRTKIYGVLRCNKNNIVTTIQTVLACHRGKTEDPVWNEGWCQGRYKPIPSIIDAVLMRYHNHDVKDIRRAGAGGNELLATTKFVIDGIEECQKNHKKAIFFVTGVPGAGKTLVGLDIVAETHKEFGSVFLSGNKPLVDVLQAELAADAKRFAGNEMAEAVIKGASMIQLIHRYRNQTLRKIDKIEKGKLRLKGARALRLLDEDETFEPEHVVVFDEAQRAWTREQLQKPGRQGKTLLCDPDFPYSEPAFLIWSMDQKSEDDWAAIVCLVGGGQEINRGEAGILEWVIAVERYFPDWHVYISPNLEGAEYAGDELEKHVRNLQHVKKVVDLHLSVSKRTIDSEKVSDFVRALLNIDVKRARALYAEFCRTYPIVLTRDLEKAKEWVRKRRDNMPERDQPQRAGVLMSSKGFRLRPFGYEIKNVGVYKDVDKWFLAPKENVESSDYLEVALTEFFVQGLEVDWSLLCWDADFRYDPAGRWRCYSGFDGEEWKECKTSMAAKYKKNAYRVLLTRARRGMAIFIPPVSGYDHTRRAECYDQTYAYLKSLGIEEL